MAFAPVTAIPTVAVAGPHAKVDALPVKVASGGTPMAPVTAIPVVAVDGATYPVAPVNTRYIFQFTPGSVPEAPVMPIPVVIVG